METRDWESKKKAKALLIGHDPRLKVSDTIAEFALFANYFFEDIPKKGSEKQKYILAKSAFDQINEITYWKIKPDEIYITNLCNKALPHAPKNKTVLIPESEVTIGLKNITRILNNNPSIEYIFAMSLQVNYWLQKFGFYSSDTNFVEKSEPKNIGLSNANPYYEPQTKKTFLDICGNQYKVNNGNQIIIPILHSKNYPINGKLVAYIKNYEKMKDYFNQSLVINK